MFELAKMFVLNVDIRSERVWVSDDDGLQFENPGSYGVWIRVFDKDDGYRDYNPVLKVPDVAVATLSSSTNHLTWSDTVTGEAGWRAGSLMGIDGGDATVTFTRRLPVPYWPYWSSEPNVLGSALIVNYSVAGTMTLGDDFTGVPGQGGVYSITIPAGSDHVDLHIHMARKQILEGRKATTVIVLNGANYVVPNIGLTPQSPVSNEVGFGFLGQSPGPDLVAHRTGLKYGETVPESVEDSNDPAKLLLLVNNDYEEGHFSNTGPDNADDSAGPGYGMALDGSLNPLDDDLMRLTMNSPILRNYGTDTFELALSNPNAVKIFGSYGQLLWKPGMQANALQGVSYFSEVYLEGLQADPDFKVSLIQKDYAGNEIARDEIHMTIAEWTQEGLDDQTPDVFGDISGIDLLRAADRVGMGWNEDLSDYAYRNKITGVSTTMLGELSAVSEDEPTDQASDPLVSISNGVESQTPLVTYQGDVLTTQEKAYIFARLGVIAVHNGDIVSKANTAGGTDSLARIPIPDDPWHHPYPIYLGGSPTQRLIKLTPEQHKAVHAFWDNIHLPTNDPNSAEAWAALKPEQRRAIIKASLTDKTVKVPEAIVDKYMNDFMADEALEATRPRVSHEQCPKIPEAEVAGGTWGQAGSGFETEALAAIERVQNLAQIVACLAVIAQGIKLGHNLMQDPPSLAGVAAASKIWHDYPTDVHAEELRARLTTWIGAYLGDGNVTTGIQYGIANVDLNKLRFDRNK